MGAAPRRSRQGENREVRSGFEVSDENVPPHFFLWTSDPASEGDGRTVHHGHGYKNVQNICFCVSVQKRYISKEGEGKGRGPATLLVTPPDGYVTRPINNRQKQFSCFFFTVTVR